jgi:hypothetical protein
MASVHTPCAFRHGPISPSVFSQLAARNDPAPVRKCIPCVHAGRDFRHGGRRQPRQGQNVRPACTRGTMFPTWTRQGGTFPLPAGSVALYPGRKSIPRVHTGRGFRHEPRWTTGSECVCPRSRTPERTRLATCPQKRIGAPAVGDRPQHRTATLPPWFVRSSSLSSSLLATANWANATYSASKAIRDCSRGELAATVHVLIHVEWNRGTWPPSTCPVYRTLRNAARKCPSRGSPSESARAVLMVASSVAMASTSWRAPVGRLP